MEVPDAFVRDVALRYGFAAGLTKARGDMVRAMQPRMKELRKLYAAKEEAVNTAKDLNELKKTISEINRKIEVVRKKMLEESFEERQRVKKFNAVIKHYDRRIVNHLKEMNLYREIHELDPEHEAIADEILKEESKKKEEKEAEEGEQ